MGVVTMGVDPGQRRDPTAIAVVEAQWRAGPTPPGAPAAVEAHHVTRFLERLPLGTPYPEVARRVKAVCSGITERSYGQQPTLYVDATGVGTPVVDVLREAGVEARLVGVYFTHGDRRSDTNGEIRLGKAWLVGRMQALLQAGRLHLPKTADAEVLARELLDYEIRIDQDANDKYGAFRVGSHDDLVTALGLATQEDGTRPLDEQTRRLLQGANFYEGRDWADVEDEQLLGRSPRGR